MKRFVLAAVGLLATPVWGQDPPLRITVRPEPAFVELTTSGQSVGCDFIVENRSGKTWVVRTIEVSAHDASGRLAGRRFVNDNGNSPSIETLNVRKVPPGQRILLFNPLFGFDRQIPLDVLSYTFTWATEDSSREVSVSLSLKPVKYAPKTSLRLPLKARTLVWDGHDYYSHHRRFNYLSAYSQETGTNSNLDRYSYDLVPVDPSGEMRRGDPSENTSWFGFGQAVYAAGGGRVVAVADDSPDNRQVDMARFEKDRLADYGNYIVIDHGGGEFALYGHLRHRSAAVKVGDVVHQGQRIAAIGASGSSLMPHLHFQLQTTAGASGEGLPSYFDRFVRVLGSRLLDVPHGSIDSGDLVEDSGSNRISRTSCPHRRPSAIRAAQTSASSRELTSSMENRHQVARPNV